MPIPLVCVGCGKKLNAPDAVQGKAIRCPNCQQVVRVPAVAPVRPGQPNKRAEAATAPAAQPARRPESSKSKSRHEEFDADDDRPHRKPAVPSGRSPLLWVLVGLGIGVAVTGSVAALLFVLFPQPNPADRPVVGAPALNADKEIKEAKDAFARAAALREAAAKDLLAAKEAANAAAKQLAAKERAAQEAVAKKAVPDLVAKNAAPKDVEDVPAKEAGATKDVIAKEETVPKEVAANKDIVDSQPAPAPAVVKPATPAKAQVFVFNGKSRIVTPLERFAPVTLEAWFRHSRVPLNRPLGNRTQYLIGSDVPGQYGYGVAIRPQGKTIGGLQMETLRTFFDADVTFSPTDWSHVAAVFGPDEVAMYLDGKQVFKKDHKLEAVGGTTFTIGKAGRDATAPFYFTGEIREVRISTGTRYLQDFAPQASFEKDETSALIYRASDVQGKKALDLSGNGRDGELDGVTVVGEEIAVKLAGGKEGGVKEYEPKSKRFTINMPIGVKSDQASKLLPIIPPKGVKLPPSKSLVQSKNPMLSVEVAYSQLSDGTKFTAASIGLPANLLREVPDEKLNELYRDVFMKPLNGQVAQETDIRQGGYTGKDYLIDLPQGKMRLQLLKLFGAAGFAFVEASTSERLAAQDVEDYFASFKMK